MGLIDRLRWRAAAAIAPRAPHQPSMDATSGVAYRNLLRSLGHHIGSCRTGDAEMSAIVHSMTGQATPFDAKVIMRTMKGRDVLASILRTIDADVRIARLLSDRSSWVTLIDPAVFDLLRPHRDEAPDITPPDGHVSLRRRDHSLMCHYCKEKRGETIDHVVPRGIGGSDTWWNIVPACVLCNSKKSHHPPVCPCDFCRRAVSMFIDGYRTG